MRSPWIIGTLLLAVAVLAGVIYRQDAVMERQRLLIRQMVGDCENLPPIVQPAQPATPSERRRAVHRAVAGPFQVLPLPPTFRLTSPDPPVPSAPDVACMASQTPDGIQCVQRAQVLI